MQADGVIHIRSSQLAKYAVFEGKRTSFEDMTSHWSKAYMDRLIGMEVMQGFADGSVRPDGEVTRDQLTAMLARALGLPTATGMPSFADADEIPRWARTDIASAIQAGLIKGYDEQGAVLFKAERTVNRAEIAVMIARVLSEKEIHAQDQTSTLLFKDAESIPSWAQASVHSALAAGIVSGYTDGMFRPSEAVTRAEAAKMIFLLLEKLNL